MHIRSPHAASTSAKQLENGHDLEAFLFTTRIIEADEELLWYFDCSQGYRYRDDPVPTEAKEAAATKTKAAQQTKTTAKGRRATEAKAVECKCVTRCSKSVGCINAPLPEGSTRTKKQKIRNSDE
jgi:hypothetical protein